MNTKIIENLVDKLMIMWLYVYARYNDARKQLRYEWLTYKEYRVRRKFLRAYERKAVLENAVISTKADISALEDAMVAAGKDAMQYKQDNRDVVH